MIQTEQSKKTAIRHTDSSGRISRKTSNTLATGVVLAIFLQYHPNSIKKGCGSHDKKISGKAIQVIFSDQFCVSLLPSVSSGICFVPGGYWCEALSGVGLGVFLLDMMQAITAKLESRYAVGEIRDDAELKQIVEALLRDDPELKQMMEDLLSKKLPLMQAALAQELHPAKESLSPVEEALETFDMEMQNGGLCQFFINEGQLLPHISECLEAVGAVQHKALLDAFLADNQIDVSQQNYDVSISAFQELYTQYPFEKFDMAYYALPPLTDYLYTDPDLTANDC